MFRRWEIENSRKCGVSTRKFWPTGWGRDINRGSHLPFYGGGRLTDVYSSFSAVYRICERAQRPLSRHRLPREWCTSGWNKGQQSRLHGWDLRNIDPKPCKIQELLKFWVILGNLAETGGGKERKGTRDNTNFTWGELSSASSTPLFLEYWEKVLV